MILDIQSLKARVKTIAEREGRTFNDVWKQLTLERFLARVAVSEHRDSFVFKGGMLLARYLKIGRETIDADFLLQKLENKTEVMEAAAKEIQGIDLKDGFVFSYRRTEQLKQPHMRYPGYRISMDVKLENIRDVLSIDIGVGDVVEPEIRKIRLLEVKDIPLFEKEIALKAYPPEGIFAEKLEAIFYRGSTTSRMKDYHDILLMIRHSTLLESEKVKHCVKATFQNLETELKLPLSFSAGEIETLQKYWAAHRRGLSRSADKLLLPETIEEAIGEINGWLGKMFWLGIGFRPPPFSFLEPPAGGMSASCRPQKSKSSARRRRHDRL